MADTPAKAQKHYFLVWVYGIFFKHFSVIRIMFSTIASRSAFFLEFHNEKVLQRSAYPLKIVQYRTLQTIKGFLGNSDWGTKPETLEPTLAS